MPSIKILLIDDDRANRQSLKTYLEWDGHYEVSEYADSQSALDSLRNSPRAHDALIMDWTLKPAGGDILRQIKAINPGLPVIVFTVNAEAGAEAYANGASAYIQKPAEPDRLAEAVEDAVNKNRTASEKSLDLIYVVSALLVEQQTLVELANAIVRKTSDLLGSNVGAFYSWNWMKSCFQGLSEDSSALLGESKSVLDKLEKTSILHENSKGGELRSILAGEFNSRAAVLLRRADLPLGLLVLGKHAGEFSEDDLKTLRALQIVVEPLMEQMKTRELIKNIEQGYTSENSIGQVIVDAVFEMLGQPTALWLLDHGYSDLRIQAAQGIPNYEKRDIRIHYNGDGSFLASTIKSSRANQWKKTETSDQGIDASDLASLKKKDVHAILGIPLLTSEGAPLGTIAIYGTRTNAFQEYDIQLTQTFAAQASKALENLHRQTQSKKLAELSETLASHEHDERNIFETFAQAVLELTGAYNVVIYPYDSKRRYWFDKVVIKGDIGKESRKKPITEKPREQGLASIVRHVRKILVEDILENDVVLKPIENLEKIPDQRNTLAHVKTMILHGKFTQRENIRAFAAISLRAPQIQAEVGVMYVNFKAPHLFTESEASTLQIAARQAASIVQAHRLTERQQMVSRTLEEVITVIGINNPEEQLSKILEKTANLFSADYGTINLLAQDGRHLRHLSRLTGETAQMEKKDDQRPIGKGVIGHVFKTGETYRTGNVHKVNFYDPYFTETESEIAIPFKNAFGGVIGVLNLESKQKDFFSTEDQELCERFAHAVSAAIQQSELFETIKSLHQLVETSNLTEVLHQVLKNLNKLIGVNSASSVNMYNQAEEKFDAFYGVGPNTDIEEKYLKLPPRKKGTGEYVISEEKPLFYNDVDNIPAGLPLLRPEAKEWSIVSYAAFPLFYQQQTLGTLYIHKMGDKITFTEDAQQMLALYADQAALAIYNAQSRVNIGPIKEIMEAVVSKDRQDILKLIVRKAVEVITADYSSIFMGDEKSGSLAQEAIYVKENEEPYYNYNMDEKIIEKGTGSTNMLVYTTRKPIIDNDVRKREADNKYLRSYEKALSEIVVPLIFQDKRIGTLNAESQHLDAYSKTDLETLSVFADMAAVAIKITEWKEEIQQQRDEIHRQTTDLYKANKSLRHQIDIFEALTEIGQQLTANVHSNEQQILGIIHQQASRIIDTDNMYVALYDVEKDLVRFELAFLDGKLVDTSNEKGWEPRSGHGPGRTEWMLQNKKSILSYTKADTEAWYQKPGAKNFIRQDFSSWLGVPIMLGTEVMGVIATYHKTEAYKYGPDDEKVLALMARQAAIALKNTRLFQQLNQRIQELNTIRELGEALSELVLPSQQI